MDSGHSHQNSRRIGKIVGCHGIRGELKIRPAAPNPDWAGKLKCVTIRLGDKNEIMTIVRSRVVKTNVLVTFSGYESRTAAEPLIGALVFADEADLPKLAAGEFYVDELVGMDVVDAVTGETVATVKDLLSSGGQDFLELLPVGKTETVLIPHTPHFFPVTDRANRRLSVSGLEGFF